MAKPIPIKKRPTATKKKKAASAEIPVKKKAGMPKAARQRLEEIEANAARRYEWALSLKKLQPESVEVVINRMTAQMARMAYEPTFSFEGVSYPVERERLRSIQYRNHLYLAMRMIVACAEWGIRIGDFKAPKTTCIRCTVTVKAKKKGKKKS